ncbi:MAG TPA: gamma-glutamyl-gamma-aminobutyrate hydrolase family protein [Flavitalea sp.]|nr:gamma-glutamyl-gamma-aminobutyrate hydrolase family protein [Flavitalea sp.]
MKIGITNCAKYSNYDKWFQGIEDVQVIKLGHVLNNHHQVSQCAAVVLTGGEDVHPDYYNPEYITRLNPSGINKARDAFEWKVVEKVFEEKKPLLGICRGLQFVNVFLGGTLIYDIPAVTGNTEHAKIAEVDQRHSIRVEKNSLLYEATGLSAGEVNSAHHQSVDVAAADLEVIAHAGSIVEAMQWKHAEKQPWMLLVQWHPERMIDQENHLASLLRDEFLRISRKAI